MLVGSVRHYRASVRAADVRRRLHFCLCCAVQDAWAFHWHNIIGRVFVYVFSYVPAEIYLELTRDASGAVVIHGVLFFVAPLFGLIATWAADQSKGRIIFSSAC